VGFFISSKKGDTLKIALNVVAVIVLCLPGMAFAGETVGTVGQGPQIALLSNDLGFALKAKEKSIKDKLEKTAAAKIIAPDLLTYLNSKDSGAHSKYADLYASPGGVLCVNPFFSSGAKGVEAEVKW
jgi:hypothetical protein